ncbi:MAG: ATP-grasp domain-containing protein [Gemmatimonadota bacterium]|nr:ATP-grasp domain-containing protein [Gemmatimonadota bacterium]MDE3126801.1 ATP-grasp domain-containing protein [Gemmatimonadota bacterium]MDE3172063.1 ATP-grasp domain-containing protein [Gemmatimonadota bacterium]
MRIAILFDGASAIATFPDLAILENVEAIERILVAEGNSVTRLPVHADGRWIERLRKGRFELAFNMCEGIDGVAALEPAVIAVLELMAIPYTGSSSFTTALCLRKHAVNGLLTNAGLPVPRFATVRRGESFQSIGYPAICKPAAEDASIGIEQKSVVRSRRALERRVEAMHERWNEVLVQRYVDGREVNVGILGDAVLPIAEIDFGGMPDGLWRIVSYRSKWEPGCEEDAGTAPRCPADLPPDLAERVRELALEAWRLVGGYGYGRVDLRIDAQGRPWILEVNPNPDIAPDAGLARMARTAGISYPRLIRTVTQLGTRRRIDVGDADRLWALAFQLSGGVDPTLDTDLFDAARQAS